jgi:hypothetical protein
MKQVFFPFILFFSFFSAYSHVEKDSISIKKDSIKTTQWAFKKTAGLLMTQTAFVNWSAGGENSIAGITSFDFEFNYEKDRLFWNNLFKSRFGLNQEKGQGVRKTDDVIEFTSNFGYRKTKNSNWYNSARFNFRTQYASGYKYPERDISISEFFAPAYIFVGVGSQYTSPTKKYKIYLSPLTNKTTLVYNQRLSNQGSFGVKKAEYDQNGVLIREGENSKIEFGTLLTGEWEHEIMENIIMNNKLILYSDFLNSFLNVDFDWEMNLQLIVNKYVKAKIGTHLIYDDDVKDEETGTAKIQLKQLLGVGVVYSF